MGQTPLSPRLLQIVGLVLLITFVIFWMITGRESALLVGAAGSLILVAQYERVRIILRDATAPSSPSAPAPTRKSDEEDETT